MVAVNDDLGALGADYSLERALLLSVLRLAEYSYFLATQVRTINYPIFALCFNVPKEVSVRKIETATVVGALKPRALKHAHNRLARLSAT